MPYFCLRVPTGGGKTWLAAKSVHVVNTHLLRCEHSVILWLVPSRPIRDQTLKGLQDRNHPYHTALRDAGPVTVMSLDEAKSVTRATLDTSTTLIVATRQAFQVEDEECRKVYQSSGALMHHFDNLSPEQRTDMDTLNVERVRNELLSNHIIPPEEIVVATGDERGLDQIQADYAQGIADLACPVKFVITQRALAEGWDCPFAYILVSMASLHSATAVEQLLGRVLRKPAASRRTARELNQSYAFVVSRNFAETAGALRDRLVAGAGFDRRDVKEFVTAAKSEQAPLDLDALAGRVVVKPVPVTLSEKPDLKTVPKAVRDKVTWDGTRNTLTINTPLTEEETESLKASQCTGPVPTPAIRH